MTRIAAPPRPRSGLERISTAWFLAFSPRIPKVVQPDPPEALAPFEVFEVPRRHGRGGLSATWFPAPEPARGAVLLLHPWLVWGRAYFHLRGRIQALREAGYHALALDFPGFGASGPPAGLYDREVEAGLEHLAGRAPGLPLHVWGVSAGGYWAHLLLSRTDSVAGAFFEDVAPHLLEWSWRMAPWGRPGYLGLRLLFPSTYRFLDLRRHAPALSPAAVAYVSGELDRGVRPEDTRILATLANAPALIVPGADHLGAIKLAGPEVIALALDTFRKAEEAALL